MKCKIQIIIFLPLYFFILSVNSFGQETLKVEEQEITSWMQQNAIPIKHVEAGNGFSDLQPLKEILKDVKIVGLGEATHGTREFFQVRHRLLEFLVTEMGYTAFVLEAPYAGCEPINEYVLNGKGDLATLLTDMWYVVWDTEEMTDLIEWIRKYNQNVPEEKKVKFFGVDINYNQHGMKDFTEFLFIDLSKEEKKLPMQHDLKSERTLQKIMPRYTGVNEFYD